MIVSYDTRCFVSFLGFRLFVHSFVPPSDSAFWRHQLDIQTCCNVLWYCRTSKDKFQSFQGYICNFHVRNSTTPKTPNWLSSSNWLCKSGGFVPVAQTLIVVIQYNVMLLSALHLAYVERCCQICIMQVSSTCHSSSLVIPSASISDLDYHF